jgi:L-iditol 2-dehydrogenase
MKAAVLSRIEDLEIIEREKPTCKPGEIVIKVEACAICKTDVKMFHGGHRDLRLPRVLGHEVAGTIVEVGGGINIKLKEGDRVQVAPGFACGSCAFCTSGIPNMCENMSITGFHHDGGFAEYMLVSANGVRNGGVNKIPEYLSFEDASLAEPLACCINAQELCHVRVGDIVVIFGAGPIGHLHAQLWRIGGASEVILIENSPERIAFSKKVDVDHLIDSRKIDPVEAVKERTDGMGADVVIPACSSPEAVIRGLEMLKKRGRIVFFSGLPHEDENISINHNLIHYKEIQIFGAYGCTPYQNKIAVEMLKTSRIDVSYLITHRISLDSIIDGFRQIERHNAMEVVVTSF